jgi:uncharacterized protein
MKIVVAGGTGFVGVKLVEKLNSLGDRVTVLARDPQKAKRQFPQEFFPHVEIVGYTLQDGDWMSVFSDCDGVVNLAGAPLASQPWTTKYKQEILSSRQLTTRKIVQAIAASSPKPKVLVNGSAIGYYGTDETKDFDEYSFVGEDFLAGVCKAWEQEADAANGMLRVVKIRTGVVLGNGGFLDKVLPIFRLGVGGKIGSGKQWFSWIHRDDLVSLIVFALTNQQLSGAVNGTAPNPVTNEEFTQALAKVLNRPAVLPAPAFAIQLALGESAILALEGQKVLPKKAEINSFQWQYPTISAALSQILN